VHVVGALQKVSSATLALLGHPGHRLFITSDDPIAKTRLRSCWPRLSEPRIVVGPLRNSCYGEQLTVLTPSINLRMWHCTTVGATTRPGEAALLAAPAPPGATYLLGRRPVYPSRSSFARDTGAVFRRRIDGFADGGS
jgi:hypothetical protein